MKRKENILIRNISRMVKSVGNRKRPTSNFVSKVINEELKELKLETGRIEMNRNKFYMIGIAALVLVVVGVGAVILPGAGNEYINRTEEVLGTIFEPGLSEKMEIELVPLDIELPKPIFSGTRRNILDQEGNSIPYSKLPRGPFFAPAGLVNVAAGKPVSASDEFPIVGEIEMVTDGDKEGLDGSYVDFGPFLQHVTIDLEQEYEIYAVLMWHFHKQARAYYDVVVQVADDVDFTQNVRTLFNNDHDNSAGFGVGKDRHFVEKNEGKLIEGKGIKARYLRAYSDGNSSDDSTHYVEIEVFGK